MEEEEHRRQVLQALEKALAKDHAKTHLSAVSPLGLVEMTRKRTRESLAHQLCAACPTCEGRGFVKTPETVCYEIFREMLRQAGAVRLPEAARARAPGRDRAPARRGIGGARRARGAGRQADPAADRVALRARPVRRGAHVNAAGRAPPAARAWRIAARRAGGAGHPRGARARRAAPRDRAGAGECRPRCRRGSSSRRGSGSNTTGIDARLRWFGPEVVLRDVRVLDSDGTQALFATREGIDRPRPVEPVPHRGARRRARPLRRPRHHGRAARRTAASGCSASASGPPTSRRSTSTGSRPGGSSSRMRRVTLSRPEDRPRTLDGRRPAARAATRPRVRDDRGLRAAAAGARRQGASSAAVARFARTRSRSSGAHRAARGHRA